MKATSMKRDDGRRTERNCHPIITRERRGGGVERFQPDQRQANEKDISRCLRSAAGARRKGQENPLNTFCAISPAEARLYPHGRLLPCCCERRKENQRSRRSAQMGKSKDLVYDDTTTMPRRKKSLVFNFTVGVRKGEKGDNVERSKTQPMERRSRSPRS